MSKEYAHAKAIFSKAKKMVECFGLKDKYAIKELLKQEQ